MDKYSFTVRATTGDGNKIVARGHCFGETLQDAFEAAEKVVRETGGSTPLIIPNGGITVQRLKGKAAGKGGQS